MWRLAIAYTIGGTLERQFGDGTLVLLALSGFVIGGIVGFATRRARFCTFGAIEDWIAGGDLRRLKAMALALGLAILGTQALIEFKLLDTLFIRYLPAELPWLAIGVGGFLFGLGMALVGTCAFGSLVRLGTGDLRSLIVIFIFAATAYATLRGALFPLRSDVFETVRIPMPNGASSGIAEIIGDAWGHAARLAAVLAAASFLLFWSLSGGQLAARPRLFIAGLVLGLSIVGGWLCTSFFADPFLIVPAPDSLTFVAPVAKTLIGSMLLSQGTLDFGAGTVIGVAAGSFAATLCAREFRWEAFDDAREMKRHLLGAVFMGFGGVLAGGCTIGQGLTAGSLMALSWPLAVGGMVAGARTGIHFLLLGLEGACVKS